MDNVITMKVKYSFTECSHNIFTKLVNSVKKVPSIYK